MYLDVLGKRINYESKGRGRPIILVHGWGGNMDSMRGLFDILAKDYQCFMLDLPGFGGSDNPDSDWGVEEYAKVVELFIHEVINQKTIYCGHSFGGALGIYLSNNSDVVEELVLLAPAFRRTGVKRTSFSQNIFYKRCKGLLYPFRKVFYRIFFPNSQLLAYPHLEANFAKIVQHDLTDIVDKISAPTLVLWGDQDSFVSVEDAYFLDSHLKNSTLRVYKGVEHNLPLAKVNDIASDINYFLNR